MRLSSIPVLVVSGYDLRAHPVREDGVLEFFQKPLDVERFVSAVQRYSVTAVEREARRRAAVKKLVSSPL